MACIDDATQSTMAMTERSYRVAPPFEHGMPAWLWCILIAVFFTPPIRLPGDIPLRVDDLLVAFLGFLMIARSFLRFRIPAPDGISVALLAMACSMPVSAYFASQTINLPIGPKEYLDLIRPLKFLFLYLAIRDAKADTCLKPLQSAFAVAVWVLTLSALVQFLLLTPESGGILPNFFLLFTDLQPDHARSFFGLRPFATFHTPTDLGYVSTILLAETLSMPREHKWWTRSACVITLTLSNTRTFLFALPLFFALCALISDDGIARKIYRLLSGFIALGVVAVLIFVMGPIVNPGFSANIVRTGNAIVTGDYAEDDSLATRLHKLDLVVYTWNNARYFGVASREMLGDAADSEYVFTFHRYGIVGMSVLMAIYVAALLKIRRLRHDERELYLFVLLVLCATFLYGFTQGALINTRTGVIPVAVLGIAASKCAAPTRKAEGLAPDEEPLQ